MGFSGLKQHCLPGLLLLPGLVQAEWMDWALEAELAAATDDNVNIAIDDFEQEDEKAAVKLRAGRAWLLEGSEHSSTRLRFSGDIARHFYNDWDDLTLTRLGGSAALHHKFGLGMKAPRLSAGVSAHYEDVRDGNREAWYYKTHIGLDRRLSPRLDLGVSVYYQFREGDDWPEANPNVDSNVYDSDHGGVILALQPVAKAAAVDHGQLLRRGIR